MKKLLYLFLGWRIFLFLPLIFSEFFLKFRKGFEYTNSISFTQLSNPMTHFLLSPWANFDGIYYLVIATSGYTVDNSVFFPLLPTLIKGLTLPFGNLKPLNPIEFFIALILVSVLFFIALILFYKLIKIDYPKNIAIWSVVFLLVFPTSFFLVSIYSEGLFLMLLLSSFYFARKKNWLLASIFGGLLTGTRFVGIAILPALVYEFWVQEKTLFKRKTLPLFIIPVGLLLYMWYNLINWKSPLHFIDAQGTFSNGRSVHEIILPPQTIFRYIKILDLLPKSQYEWWIALLELSVFIFASVMLFIAWKKRIRTSYLIFSMIAFFIPILTGTFTGLPRYVLPLFPMFIALALIKNKTLRVLYIVISAILLFILFVFFSKSYFVS